MATSKLWILRPIREVRDRQDDNPWNPWYDKAMGFVVRARTETEARELAHGEAGEENRVLDHRHHRINAQTPWLDNNYSSCEVITAKGEPKVLIKDFAAA